VSFVIRVTAHKGSKTKKMPEKIKILTISDNPLAPSGVGIQTKNMIEGLLKTGKYSFFSFAGAIQHHDHSPVQLEEYGDDWVIQPVEGFGNDEQIRSIIRTFRPDLVWLMTDPRFFDWLWAMENEIRPNVPMVYYHVWDNKPYPTFNKKYYESNDFVVSISKLTDDIVRTVAPAVDTKRIAHAVDTTIFKKIEDGEVMELPKDSDLRDKFVFFWNNRNARRKQSGTIIFWFNEFLDKVGRDNAALVMHTDPRDPNGQDLPEIINHLDLEKSVFLSTRKLPPEQLNRLYNLASCTVNISDAEGFGLSTLESLAAETPIIATMTGGLQEQITDGEEWFGIGIEPTSKTVIGSLQVPWIYEDRISKEDFLTALENIFNMSKEELDNLGKKGRQHVLNEYGLDQYVKNWDNLIMQVVEEKGSWNTRKGYKSWKFGEVK
jgi:glycosyltransferase involved in cell wall biosynthesis